MVARVRRFIDERGKMPSDRYDLRRPFDNFDADGQGSIDREELVPCCLWCVVLTLFFLVRNNVFSFSGCL